MATLREPAHLPVELGWRERHASAIRQVRLYAWTFSRSFSSLLGLVLVLGFLLLALIGPWIVPYPEDALGNVNLDPKLLPPSAEHWFGTDEVGRDIYTRVVLGAGLSLQIGLIIVGGLVWGLGRVIELGHLPGDFTWQRGNTRIYVPLTTMIVLSLVLTLLLNVILRLFR